MMIKSYPRIYLFVLTFPPLFTYLHAQGSSISAGSKGGALSWVTWKGGRGTVGDNYKGGGGGGGGSGYGGGGGGGSSRRDGFEDRRICGCGGDRCEKLGVCHTQGFIPVCCNNVCRCMNTKVQGFSRDMDRKCELCEQLGKITSICRDVTEDEFCCWKQHLDPIPKPDLDLISEFIYA